MAEPIISVRGLGKQYWLSHQKRADTLRDTFIALGRSLKSRLAGRSGHADEEEFWALRDVSFDVHRGEVVGIIGRNGAGKSTLLKVLSRITEPTTGSVHLRGRVASLLEVGTGFHPELTGRDNIYLNGAILGMSRAEIRRKFDEIVAFAEVERFLDMRVKHYSSGMYVRLAFAVAAHLEPEILIVDEVLAVGDAAFQEKCLGRMGTIAREGRTVLFVSHNLGAVQALCTRALLLQSGNLRATGSTAEVIKLFYDTLASRQVHAGEFSNSDPALRVDECRLEAKDRDVWLYVRATVRATREIGVGFEVHLSAASGMPVAFAEQGTLITSERLVCRRGELSKAWRVPLNSLANGPYVVALQIVEPMVRVITRIDRLFTFDLKRAPRPGAGHALEQTWGAGYVELPLLPCVDPAADERRDPQ